MPPVRYESNRERLGIALMTAVVVSGRAGQAVMPVFSAATRRRTARRG